MNADLSPATTVLGAWDIVPTGAIEAMQPEGTFRVPAESGGDLILTRIGPVDTQTTEWASLKYDVLRHLATAGIPVAVPLPDGRGRIVVPADGHLYTLQPRLPGRQGSSVPEDCDSLYRNYGVAIARMHRALATFPSEALGGRVRREDLEPWVFEEEIPRIAQYLSGAQEAQFRAMLADVGEDMRAAFRGLPEQLLHRDCHAGNLLSCGTEITGIIDWDHLRVGTRIYDLAYFGAQLAKRHVGNPETMERWLHDVSLVLQSYDQVNPLSEKEKAAFPYVVIAQLITFAGWVVETEWFEALQTELGAMVWMHTNLCVVRDRVFAAWGEGGYMLIQEEMIERVRQLCHEDERVTAAMMYGSFTKGEGDNHSDIEFSIYVDDAAYDSFEPLPWVSQIAPVALYFVNEFGTGTALFDNLVRGEFHFERAMDMSKLRDLRQLGDFGGAAAMLVYDHTGELLTYLRYISGPGPDRGTRENITRLWHNYLNWMLFGASVLARGERARALEILWYVHRYLLWFVRLREGTTEHWLTPSKNLERDLSESAYDRYVTCTATLRDSELERAYRAAWAWGKELVRALSHEYGVDLLEPLVERLHARFTDVFGTERAG